jgi:hypothetical protein
MRRTKLILGLLGLMMTMAMAFAAPALAEHQDFDRFDNDGFFFIGDDFDRDDFFFDRDDFFFDGDRFDDDGFFFDRDDRFDFDFDFDFDGDGGLSQDFEQEAESGDVDQSFEISGGGDNANQCVNVYGASNTGNAQDSSGFVSFDSDINDFEQEDIGSELSVDGNSDVSCDQQVNQAAAAD